MEFNPDRNLSFSDFIRILSGRLGTTTVDISFEETHDNIFCTYGSHSMNLMDKFRSYGKEPAALVLYFPEIIKEVFSQFYLINYPVIIISNKHNRKELEDGWILHDNISDSRMDTIETTDKVPWVSRKTQCISLTKKFLSDVFKDF
ncbi:MAG: hypothetical protein ACYDDC_08330 [Thermoplasmataceae archaeon]